MNYQASDPYWKNILKHFEIKGYIHNGLTLPFLIGARQYVEPKQRLLSLEELLQQLSIVGCTMLKCNNIGEFVTGSLDSATANMKNAYHCIERIVVTDNSMDNISTIPQLIVHMKSKYDENVNSKKYSKTLGTWEFFTKEEIKQLKEVNVYFS
ncbi:MAG: hypothetical protein JNJ75_03620 [Cyclobacteriaceae bacterium]|nr:hypothetical protein [Cyclobacteriaceae bacterium]